jgi:hypothetical protein
MTALSPRERLPKYLIDQQAKSAVEMYSAPKYIPVDSTVAQDNGTILGRNEFPRDAGIPLGDFQTAYDPGPPATTDASILLGEGALFLMHGFHSFPDLFIERALKC